jgi:hypothetical protein
MRITCAGFGIFFVLHNAAHPDSSEKRKPFNELTPLRIWLLRNIASPRLPQHNLRRILDVRNDQKSLGCGRVWIVACENLQWPDRLNNACAIGICFQDRKWLKFAEWRLIRFRQVNLISRLRSKPSRRDLNKIQQTD